MWCLITYNSILFQQNPPEFSFNKWEATDLGSSSQTEKFRRLMGIKTNVDPNQVKNVQKRDDKKMFTDLEENFEKARKIRQGGRGMGLGFSTWKSSLLLKSLKKWNK